MYAVFTMIEYISLHMRLNVLTIGVLKRGSKTKCLNLLVGCKSRTKRTNNHKKFVDPPNDRYYKALNTEWELVRHSNDFLLTSAYSWNIGKWDHVTSCDNIMSDFHQNFRKYFFLCCCVMVQIWSHLHNLQKSYEDFRILSFNM